MRVVMVIMQFHPIVGGAEIQARRLAQALQRRGVELTILTSRLPGTPASEQLDGLPIIRHPARRPPWGYLLGLAWSLWRLRHTYDLIHAHQMTYSAFAACMLGKRLNKPIIAKPGNSGERFDLHWLMRHHPRWGHLAVQQITRNLTTAVAISTAVATDLRRYDFSSARIASIPNGVPLPALPDAAQRAAARAQLGIPATATHLIYTGRLTPQKRLQDLVTACAQLPHSLAWHLTLVGDGRERPLLAELIASHNLHSRITISGMQPDVTPYLHSADIFVNPSAVEGLSNALLEALSYAIPAAVSDIEPNQDIIVHAKNGLLFPAADPPALAASLQHLIENPTLRQELGAAGRHTVAQHFDIERVADQYVKLYAQLLGSTP